MRSPALSSIMRVTLAAALISCVGSDTITRPDADGASSDGVPRAGGLSQHSAEPGVLSANSPRWLPGEGTALVPTETVQAGGNLASAVVLPTTRLLWQNTGTGERS